MARGRCVADGSPMTADFDRERVVDLAREAEFVIGPLHVRPATRQVESDRASETLEPRIMQVLVALACKRGEVVSRDELIETCWEGRIVGDDALNRCTSRIRKLGETSGAFRLETIPRVGYRLWVAEGTKSQNGTAATAGSTKRERKWPLPILIAGGAAAVLALSALVYGLIANSRVVDVKPPTQRVAFFGFTAADDNPLSARIAADATDKTFAELTRMSLDAAANTATLGASADDRLTRANALGAAYALSGEVRAEGEAVRFAIRLEDAATRATLWESRETSPVARTFYSPSKQAAFRAAANTLCVVQLRAELSSSQALQAILDYCVMPFSPSASTGMENGLVALRSLAELEPPSVFLLSAHATNLVYTAGFLPPDLQAERLREADNYIAKALRISPGYSFAIAAAEYAQSSKGGSPFEAEKLLETAQHEKIVRPSVSAYAEAFFLFRRGLNLLGNGLTEEAVGRLREASALQPAFTQLAAFHALALAGQGKAADARLLFEQTFASEPVGKNVWPVWASTAVLEGWGDAEAIIAAAPENVPPSSVACWQAALAAKHAGEPGPPLENLRDCGLSFSVLVALGRVDDAFDLYQSSPGRVDRLLLFAPFARPMREDKRFLPLVKDLKLWDHWIATGSHPDVCDLPAEKDFAFCVQLRKEQA
jgi:DNA-binding winged helix-turn-helix (wHTH) protein/TolB-like protein